MHAHRPASVNITDMFVLIVTTSVPHREQVVDMSAGDLFIIRYAPVAPLVAQGQAVLI